MRGLVCVLLGVVSLSAFAQDGLAGKGKYPQARTLSGLSGGAVPILPNGRPSIAGALTFSTPIGYTLSANRAIMIGGSASSSGSFRWFDGKTNVNRSNGTAATLIGMPFGKGSAAISIMQTSRLTEDRVVNLQVSPWRASGRSSVSLGIQDLFDKTVTTPDYHECDRSVFAATTYDAGKGVFLTAGAGTARFRQGFASVSVPIGRSARAMLEHDGYGWNVGTSFAVGSVSLAGGKSSQAVVFLGLVQGKYVTWSAGFKN